MTQLYGFSYLRLFKHIEIKLTTIAMETYAPRRISDIDIRSDKKVCLAGKVADVKQDGDFTLDDGNKIIEIVNDIKLDFLKPNTKVRVFATNFDGKLKADIIQDVKNLDLDLFNRTMELYNKAGL